MTNQTLILDLIPGGAEPVLNVSQYDEGQTWAFNLYYGGVPFTIPTGSSVGIRGTKPDRKGFFYSCTYSGSVVTAIEQLQMTVVAGKVSAEIVVTKGSETIGSANFIIMVERAALSEDSDISDSELPAIIDLAQSHERNAEAWSSGTKDGVPVTDVDEQYHNNAKYYAESIGVYGHDAEAWAVGTRDGEDVPSSDETYHNNSKYYAEQSGTSASVATSQAALSEDYATDARRSADEAASWASNTPYIGPNGNWFVYDATTKTYVDSGVDASITVDIDGITMLDPTETPYVTNSGTNTDPIFHLFIPRGKGIASIAKSGTSGLVDTYTITYSDGAITTYNVTNGKSAYQSAVEGGYSGTEAKFEDDLAHFGEWASDAETASATAVTSASNAVQSAEDAANSASLAAQYADYVEPDFIIQDNRLYMKRGGTSDFIVANNRLYVKLAG